MKVLLLGGTTEAAALARLLAADTRFDATLSLAGRTAEPAASPLPTRVGGFGGAAGLARYLTENNVDSLIDATHPYAAQITMNAVEAATDSGVQLLAVRRPPWERQEGDLWQEVADAEAAVAALGAQPKRVFLAMGRLEAHVFAKAPQHEYLLRSIDHPGALPFPYVTVVTMRGPFDLAEETALLKDKRIEVLVSKNSGGSATYAKIQAARELGLPVIMLARPALPWSDSVATVAETMQWLGARHEALAQRGV